MTIASRLGTLVTAAGLLVTSALPAAPQAPEPSYERSCVAGEFARALLSAVEPDSRVQFPKWANNFQSSKDLFVSVEGKTGANGEFWFYANYDPARKKVEFAANVSGPDAPLKFASMYGSLFPRTKKGDHIIGPPRERTEDKGKPGYDEAYRAVQKFRAAVEAAPKKCGFGFGLE